MECILRHKASLSKYNNVENFSCILSEHNEIKQTTAKETT
jgi:hypothetical protein